jgi:hypothetical protein
MRKSVREKVTPDNAGQRRMSHFLMTRKKKGPSAGCGHWGVPVRAQSHFYWQWQSFIFLSF